MLRTTAISSFVFGVMLSLHAATAAERPSTNEITLDDLLGEKRAQYEESRIVKALRRERLAARGRDADASSSETTVEEPDDEAVREMEREMSELQSRLNSARYKRWMALAVYGLFIFVPVILGALVRTALKRGRS